MTIRDQTGNDIDETVGRAAMTSMLDLRNVLELIDNTFNNGSFAQEQFIEPR